MTPEQLASARAAHWREDARPILTLEDAKVWLEQMQLCLYLPRKNQVLAPAPSFVGAVLGNSNATPAAETIEQAHTFLVRLVTEGLVVPLNLFGVANSGEQPDFLVTTTALAALAALQGDRTWKKPPSRTGPGKVSPLAIEIWKLLEREGTLTATEIRLQLGHELTEAATLRGLSELWQNLRVAPLPQPAGQPAQWEILSVTHKKEMAAAGTMAQSAALSLLVSDYLQSVITATAEDIEAFLSPVASRSRLRDVIRGLGATRQLRTLSMDAQTFYFIEGTLPDMPEIAAVAATGLAGEASAEGAAEAAKPAFMGRTAYRERMIKKGREEREARDPGNSAETDRPTTYDGKYPERRSARPVREGDRPGESAYPPRRDPAYRPSDRPSARPASGARPAGSARFAAGPRRFGSSSGTARPSFSDRARSAPGSPPARSFSRPPGRSFSRPPAGPSDKPYTRPASDRPPSRRFDGSGGQGAPERPRAPRPFTREGNERPRTGDRPFRPRPSGDGSRPPFRGKPADGSARPFKPRPSGDRQRPYSGRPSSDRPSSGRPPSDRPSSSRPTAGRPSTGRSYSDRPSSSGRSASSRPAPSRAPGNFVKRDGPPGTPPAKDRWRNRPSGPGGRPSTGARPGNAKPGGRPGSRSRPAAGGSRPTSRGGPPERRPGQPGRNPGGTGRPKFFSSKPGGSRPGAGGAKPRPASPHPANSRPGGMRPPTRKPRKESDSE